MNTPLAPVLAWAFDHTWAVSLMGAAAALLAFFLGRRLLVPARRPAGQGEGALSENFLAGVVTDRRATPRRPGNAVAIDLQDGTALLEGWVRNRSLGGLCLLVDRAVPDGTPLKVRPHKAPDSVPWTTVKVKDCRPDDGWWELNCQFVQTPSWNVLLLFG